MRINVNNLLKHSTSELWDILDGEFTLVFSDGEIETDARHTIYSSYVWDLVREFYHVKLKKKNHLDSVLNGKLLSISSNTQLIGTLIWRIYHHYVDHPEHLEAVMGSVLHYQDLKDVLAQRAFSIVNNMYNDLSYRLEDYVITIKIDDFIEILDYPEISKVLSTPDYTELYVQEVYDTVERCLIHEPNNYQGEGPEPIAKRNIISRLVRSKLVDSNQLNQCVGVRGFITDINSDQFPIPIVRNLTNGIRSFHDSLIESRSASKALAFQTAPLQQTEYFNRRLQLTTLNLRDLDAGDCGSTDYFVWRGVRKSDLKNLVGKYYLNEKGTLSVVREEDTHLIGQTLKLRSPVKCWSVNPRGVCETCFGELSLMVFKDTNLGWFCSTNLCQILSQSVLSVKHLDGSSVVDQIELCDTSAKYLRVNREGDGYLIQPNIRLANTRILIRPSDAPGFTDILEIDDVRKLSTSRVTALDRIRLDITSPKGDGSVEDNVELSVGMVRRPASFTQDMLEHIRKTGWDVDENGNYVISLDGWDARKVMMTIPHRHFNMSDLADQIAALLEASAKASVIRYRDTELQWDSFIMDLYELVNSRLKVNLAILEVIAYAVMIESASKKAYGLPKPWTRNAFGVQARSIALRSLSAAMAYQGHMNIITNPISFNVTNRMDHPLDVLLDPVAVLEDYRRKQRVNTVVEPIDPSLLKPS